MNTQFDYMYRDAANWKTHYETVFAGELTPDQIAAILDACDGEHFIPSVLGMRGGLHEGDAGYDFQYDHPWCEHNFEDSFRITNKAPTEKLTAEQLVQAFTLCKGKWEEYDASGRDVSFDILATPLKAPLTEQIKNASNHRDTSKSQSMNHPEIGR